MYPSNNRHKGSALLTWLIILTVLIVALIVLLPFGIRYAAERWFYDHGAEQAVIKEVHFNLFTGEQGISRDLARSICIANQACSNGD